MALRQLGTLNIWSQTPAASSDSDKLLEAEPVKGGVILVVIRGTQSHVDLPLELVIDQCT